MTDITTTPEQTGIENGKPNRRIGRLRDLGDLGTNGLIVLPEVEPTPEVPGAEAAKALTDIIADYGPVIADLHARLDKIDITDAPQVVRGSVEIAQSSTRDFGATLEKVRGWTDGILRREIEKAAAAENETGNE